MNDLISAGTIGLIAAVDHFVPCDHVRLRIRAAYKIRVAILDSLRDLDWVPSEKGEITFVVSNRLKPRQGSPCSGKCEQWF
ncbi:MAG TPA: hypothetical protein VKX49_24095 [Bryobacteraceae bacterium]|nr:hypothetical protein [Bryobacteraceae bacterium]